MNKSVPLAEADYHVSKSPMDVEVYYNRGRVYLDGRKLHEVINKNYNTQENGSKGYSKSRRESPKRHGSREGEKKCG